MLFNSLQFLLFFIIITIAYWYLPNKFRWILLLAGSCYFYMVYVPIYILVLAFTIVIDYFAGLLIETTTERKLKKLFLIVSLIANIGILVFFKYFNFLNDSLNGLLSYSAHRSPFQNMAFLLPIGLSFHTFQAMSYTIEVYRGNHPAERKFGIYALYVMFYPQLVAGPIERPQNILWQFHKNHSFDFEQLKSGLMQMAFGLFKKVVMADRIAEIVDKTYADPHAQNGKTFFIVSILYSFQIYCDFSGYSDIGIGAARTMGYKLVNNFNAPYLAQSFADFWSKWHMSLSTWFRDYLYIPLGGNRAGHLRKYINLLIVFLVSGLWHGASWTFVIWGLFHGVLLVLENIKDHFLPGNAQKNIYYTTGKRVLTFLVVTFGWIFFRSPDLLTAGSIFKQIFSVGIFSPFNYQITNLPVLIFCGLLILLLLLKDAYLPVIPTKNTRLFYLNLLLLLTACYLFGIFNSQSFIYFQF